LIKKLTTVFFHYIFHSKKPKKKKSHFYLKDTTSVYYELKIVEKEKVLVLKEVDMFDSSQYKSINLNEDNIEKLLYQLHYNGC
jgi:hypothetical protein